MLPDSQLLCAQSVHTYPKNCLGGIIQVAITQEPWEDPTHLFLTGTPTSSVPPCNTASASPSRTRTHKAPCVVTSSIDFVIMSQSAHARETATSEYVCLCLLRSRPGSRTPSSEGKISAYSNRVQSRTVFHIGPVMTDLLTSGFPMGKT